MKDSESQKSTVSEGTTAPEGETNGVTAVVSFAPFLGIRALKMERKRIKSSLRSLSKKPVKWTCDEEIVLVYQ